MLIYLYGQFILETSSWFCRIVAGISCPFLSDVLIFFFSLFRFICRICRLVSWSCKQVDTCCRLLTACLHKLFTTEKKNVLSIYTTEEEEVARAHTDASEKKKRICQ